MILLHGLGGSWEDWVELISILCPMFHVCALDLPGFGMSPPPSDGFQEYNLEFVASFICKFMDVKDYPHAFLIGNSMGGGVTLRFAIDFPERVRGIVLANGIGLGKEISGFNRLLAIPGLARFTIPFVSKEMVSSIWKSLFFNPDVISQAMLNRTWEWIRKAETKAFLIHLYPRALSIWGQKYLVLNELRRIKCPSLITWGINDSVLPFKHAIKAYQQIQSAELYLIRDCGHVPQIERSKLFNQVTLRFLKDSLLD